MNLNLSLLFLVAASVCFLPALTAGPFIGENYTKGYITLEEPYQLFYMFFRSRDRNPNAPFIIWIQGGPGCAATSSLMGETGPYEILSDLNLTQRQYSINNFADALFVDQPLGTGFSNCSDKSRIPRDETGVVRDMLTFYGKFLLLFPELRARGVYLVGQSYAGHYVPALAKGFLEAGYKVNGAAINNGWYNPSLHTAHRGEFATKHKLGSAWELALGRVVEKLQVMAIDMGWYWATPTWKTSSAYPRRDPSWALATANSSTATTRSKRS